MGRLIFLHHLVYCRPFFPACVCLYVFYFYFWNRTKQNQGHTLYTFIKIYVFHSICISLTFFHVINIHIFFKAVSYVLLYIKPVPFFSRYYGMCLIRVFMAQKTKSLKHQILYSDPQLLEKHFFFLCGHYIFISHWSQDFSWKLQIVFSCAHASSQLENTARHLEVLQRDYLELSFWDCIPVPPLVNSVTLGKLLALPVSSSVK